MSTYKNSIVLEVGAAGLASAGLMAAIAPADPGLSGFALHPAWIAIVIMAARYGLRGLCLALPTVWASIALVASLTGAGASGLLGRFSAVSDISILCVTLLVSWIAQGHQSRKRAMKKQLADLKDRSVRESDTVHQLAAAVTELRARNDRTELSLAFIRDIAGRIVSDNAEEAACAALELATTRTGARAGVVHTVEGDRYRTLAWRGAWMPNCPMPPDIVSDATAKFATECQRAVDVRDLVGASTTDSDIAYAIRSEAAFSAPTVTSVIALRGVPLAAMNASKRELEMIGGWLADSMALAADAEADAADAALAAQAAAYEEEPATVAAGLTEERISAAFISATGDGRAQYRAVTSTGQSRLSTSTGRVRARSAGVVDAITRTLIAELHAAPAPRLANDNTSRDSLPYDEIEILVGDKSSGVGDNTDTRRRFARGTNPPPGTRVARPISVLAATLRADARTEDTVEEVDSSKQDDANRSKKRSISEMWV